MMYTPAGLAIFRDRSLNQALVGILREWCTYLDSPASRDVLPPTSGCRRPPGRNSSSTTSRSTSRSLMVGFTQPYGGLASFNDFFHREVRPDRRPIAGDTDPKIIVAPNDGRVVKIQGNVRRTDEFWVKGQRFSLHDMLDGSDLTTGFVGGDVYQSFLAGSDYHRWHASVNARALIFIQSPDPIGVVCVMPVGITEISSLTIAVAPGRQVDKGDELGLFQLRRFQHGPGLPAGCRGRLRRAGQHDREHGEGPVVRGQLADRAHRLSTVKPVAGWPRGPWPGVRAALRWAPRAPRSRTERAPRGGPPRCARGGDRRATLSGKARVTECRGRPGWSTRLSGRDGGNPGSMAGIELISDAFNDHAFLARQYAFEGANTSPPLKWRGVPDDASELVLLCEDPDAPSGTFVHQVVVGIDPRSDGVAAGQTPPGGTELVNGFGERGWGGPHPPPGDEAHRYFFRLYVLGEPCVLPDAPSAEQVHQAVDPRQLASGNLVALYHR